MPGREELPDTVRRSPAKAQRTWIKAHDSAVQEYGEGERAHRTAFAALKHSYEKVGDRWVPKRRPGRSDPDPRRSAEKFGGVDVAGHTRDELYERAKRLGVRGRSRMSKRDLARAIADKQD
jgi:cation transport regulator ChaB